jgi:hypothetical protein
MLGRKAFFAILETHMKKARYIQFFFILGLFLTFTTAVRADDMAPASAPITADVSVASTTDTADLPIILPTNPFYFAKEFARGVRLFFTFGKINKATYQLEVADQRALEVKEIEKIDPSNTDAIKKALAHYTDDVASLKPKIESLANASSDPRVGALLTNLSDEAVSHALLFKDLKTNTAVKASVDQAESAVTATITAGATKLDAPEAAQALIQKVTQAAVMLPTQIKTTANQATGVDTSAVSATAATREASTVSVPADSKVETGTNIQMQMVPVKVSAPASIR